MIHALVMAMVLGQTIKDNEPPTEQQLVVGAVQLTPEQKAEAVKLVMQIATLLGVEDSVVSDRDQYLKDKGWANNPNQPGGLWLWEKEITYKVDDGAAEVTRTFRVDRDTAITIQQNLDNLPAPPASTLKLDTENFLKNAGWVNIGLDVWKREIEYQSADGTMITRVFYVDCYRAALTQQGISRETLDSIREYDPDVVKALGVKSFARY